MCRLVPFSGRISLFLRYVLQSSVTLSGLVEFDVFLCFMWYWEEVYASVLMLLSNKFLTPINSFLYLS